MNYLRENVLFENLLRYENVDVVFLEWIREFGNKMCSLEILICEDVVIFC